MSMMEDRKSLVTLGQGGPIALEILITVYHALAEAGTKGLGVVQTVDSQGNQDQTLT